MTRRGVRLLECVGLVEIAAHDEGEQRQRRADDERNAPAEGAQLLAGQEHVLQRQQHDERGELPADQRHIEKARIEAAPLGSRHLREIGGAGAVFAAETQALQQPRREQQRRGADADRRVGRRAGDDQRAQTHQQHRQHQRGLAPARVGDHAEQPAADRAHEEADSENRGGRQVLRDRIVAGKEGLGEIERERGIGVEVVIFDEIAERPDQDRLHPPRDVRRVRYRHVVLHAHSSATARSATRWEGRGNQGRYAMFPFSEISAIVIPAKAGIQGYAHAAKSGCPLSRA